MLTLNVLTDAAGSIVQCSSEPLQASTGLTLVTGLDPAGGFADPGALFDDTGRCRWAVSAGAVVPVPPRWPATPALKRAASVTVRGRINDALLAILALERWQSDPANVAAADRSAELTAANARLGQLRDILAGA